jgi:hypothetical protein
MPSDRTDGAEVPPGVDIAMSGHQLKTAVAAQLETGLLGLDGSSDWLPEPPVQHYPSSERLWADVLESRIRACRAVVLHDVLLSEWYPWSPGRYQQPGAGYIRSRAMQSSRYSSEELRRHFGISSSQSVVFRMGGKSGMIDGGIGCVRLSARAAPSGDLWFMSATSGHLVEQGFPVALTDSTYNRCIDEIIAHGSLPCTLVGMLATLPPDLTKAYGAYSGVPRLYLRVEEVKKAMPKVADLRRALTAHAVVSFEASDSTYGRTAGAYANFKPGILGSLDQAVSFLDTYVHKLNAAMIITDFDEQVTRFPDTVFPLDRAATGRLDEAHVARAQDRLTRNGEWDHRALLDLLNEYERTRISLTVNQPRININARNLLMGDIFSNIGAGAVIVNRSTVQDALNGAWAGQNGEAGQAAIRDLEQAVLNLPPGKERDAAAEGFNGLTEELAKQTPNKHRVLIWLGAVKDALPDVVQVAAAIAKISTTWR